MNALAARFILENTALYEAEDIDRARRWMDEEVVTGTDNPPWGINWIDVGITATYDGNPVLRTPEQVFYSGESPL